MTTPTCGHPLDGHTGHGPWCNAGRPTPQPQDDTVVQIACGLAETPVGQKLAITITALVGKDNALALADAIGKVAAQMSSSGLIAAGTAPAAVTNGNGVKP